jgi:hypothetical protein
MAATHGTSLRSAIVRIILFAGKGGVGKTSVAAATGIKAAQMGHRTVVMSLDVAHSLADIFDFDKDLLFLALDDLNPVVRRFSHLLLQVIDAGSFFFNILKRSLPDPLRFNQLAFFLKILLPLQRFFFYLP